MERPTQLPAVRIEGANISRRGGEHLTHQAADDDQIFVNHRGAGHADPIQGLTAQAFTQIDAS